MRLYLFGLFHFDQRFVLLTADRAGPQRHRSLEATVAWSYNLLDETQRCALRHVAVFAGPVDFALVNSIWPDSPTSLMKALTELVDRSMVATTRQGATTKYRLLDTIRTFTLDRSKAIGDLDELRRHHAEAFASKAESVRTLLRGAHEADAVKTLDTWWPELRTAVGWCIEANEPSIAIRLVAGFGFEAVFRERREVLDWAEQVLSLPDILACPDADELLGTSAMADWGFGNFERGWDRARHAVLLHKERKTAPTPDVLAAHPLHQAMTENLAASLASLQAHEREAQAGTVPFSEAHLLCCQAMAHAYVGCCDKAEPLLRRADAIAITTANPLLQTIVAFTRAIAVLDGDPARAVEFAEESLRLARSVRATWFETASTNYLTAAMVRVGDIHVAAGQLIETLDRLMHGATSQSAANTLRNTVVVLDRLGVPERAAAVVGWLEQNHPAIPGTPGMRDHPAMLSDLLRRDLGITRANELIEAGSLLTLPHAIAVARQELVAVAEPTTPKETYLSAPQE